MSRYLGLLAGLLLAAWVTGIALAQDEQPTDDEVNAVAKGLYCPVCENVPLDVCPTQACKQWRDTIRDKLALGWTQEQIEQYFVDQYGDRVLATPPATGLNWLVYLLPPVAFVAGVVILAGAVRGWRKPSVSAIESASEPAVDPYLERVEEELRRRA
ncbi:MAG: cytochrome c-type biogenesis protein CcmH [Anaerolineales bacterium]